MTSIHSFLVGAALVAILWLYVDRTSLLARAKAGEAAAIADVQALIANVRGRF